MLASATDHVRHMGNYVHDVLGGPGSRGTTTGGKGSLVEGYDKKVRPLIDLIDRLRKIGLDKDVGLPTIVVVGDQSTGKSSVLEAISGVQLPRGTGTVTRCPLELRLKRKDTWSGRIIYKDKQEELISPEQVGILVREAQNAIVGPGKGVSSDLIRLEIEDPNLPDLTLIDLPGIIRVAPTGQPDDMPKKINDLIKSYIRKQETIILAVIPANTDIETTGALQMASDVDPDHTRTLGVLTKCDLVDKGAESHLIDVLEGEIYPLQKGFIAVKCRGQADLDREMSLADALREEEHFFKSQEHFSGIDVSFFGIKSLSNRLTDELVEQVQRVLPSMREQIFLKRDEKRKALMELGDGIPDDDSSKCRFLLKLLIKYNDDLKDLLAGQKDNGASGPNIHNKARIAFQEFAEFIKRYGTSPEFKEIQKALQENRGPELPHFVKFDIFQDFIIKIIKKFKQPGKKCMHTVELAVKEKLIRMAKDRFQGFPMVENKVKDLVVSEMNATVEKAEQSIDELLDMEELVYSQDEHFNTGLANLNNQMMKEKIESAQNGKCKTMSFWNLESQTDTIDTMLILMKGYMQISVPRVADLVPMIIKQNLIKKAINNLQENTLCLVEPSSGLLSSLKEDKSTKRKRDNLTQALDRLEKATIELDAFQAEHCQA